MAKALSDESLSDIRLLIQKMTKLTPPSPQLVAIEKNFVTQIKRADSMYFLNTKDIDRAVSSMADKFMFHGFFRHAEYLKLALNRYIDKNLSESDLTPRLNVVKFLLCMSESPTTIFWKNPEEFDFIKPVQKEEEVIDWGAYLNEGIETWAPAMNEDSSESSFDQSDREDFDHIDIARSSKALILQVENAKEINFRASRNELLDSVQHTWFYTRICMEPPSEHFQANVGILWEKYLERESYGLIKIEPVTVISEYKVMREILWQLWGPHASVVFQMDRNKICCRKNVTVSSVRTDTFTHFMEHFLHYIELLDEFRQFESSLHSNPFEKIPETYRSYSQSLQHIISPLYLELADLENEIRTQETSMTLLKLAKKLEDLFKPIKVLKEIHDEVVCDFRSQTALNCSLNLLVKLDQSLAFSLNKLEQDVRLSVYLESLSHYFHIIEAWLVKNDFNDFSREFVIEFYDKNTDNTKEDWMMNFNVKKFTSESLLQDGIIKIICDKVLQIGRNIHFLRLLGKYDVFTKGTETIHEEFTRRILEQLCHFYDFQQSDLIFDKPSKESTQSDLGTWSNYVDLSDGFLVKAFEHFDAPKVANNKILSLFEKVNMVTKNLFPVQKLHERILNEILEDRFTISGLMVKNLLLEHYHLEGQFEFLNHVFLFDNDLIFPFYIRLFEKMNMSNSNWGNSVWLTSHFQDVIMDCYPNFYENCTVQVKDYWKDCCDSIEALSLLQLNYTIKWPMDIIITADHILLYRELFEIILKVKWALFVLNRLWFADLELGNGPSNSSVAYKSITKKLQYLRFGLINLFNSIQHHVFGSILAKCRIRFRQDFTKANDLKSLMNAHGTFINGVHSSIDRMVAKKDQTDKNDVGFVSLLKCVKMLKIMWNKREYAKYENLEKCHKMYKLSSEEIMSHINPVNIFD